MGSSQHAGQQGDNRSFVHACKLTENFKKIKLKGCSCPYILTFLAKSLEN
jgi:hypothetical protein